MGDNLKDATSMDTLPQKTSQIIPTSKNVLERIGNALVFIGFVAIMSLLVITVLSIPSASRGWEYVWFLPRVGFLYILISAMMLLVLGLAIRFIPKFIKK